MNLNVILIPSGWRPGWRPGQHYLVRVCIVKVDGITIQNAKPIQETQEIPCVQS